MTTAQLLKNQAQYARGLARSLMADVTPEQAHAAPAGRANPIGASFYHTIGGEDFAVNASVRGKEMVAARIGGKTGASELPPQGFEWGDWGRAVHFDFDAARAHGDAVAAETDAWLDSLTDEDLTRPVDFTGFGLGMQDVTWTLTNLVIGHIFGHAGEISALKGIQGNKGYAM